MITVFNRREVLITFDAEIFNAARLSLAQNGIDYKYRIPSSGVSRSRSFFASARQACIYQLFVHKDDEEEGQRIVSQILNNR